MFSFVESKLFTRLVGDYLTDDEYAELRAALAEAPERGAIRVIYYAKNEEQNS